MTKPKLILIGAGGHARSCIEVIEQQGQYQIAGLVGLPEQKYTHQFGYSVFASDDELQELSKFYQYALITIGQIKTPKNRKRLYQKAVEYGFKMPVIIATTAIVSRYASIGLGSIVMHGAIVNAGATIGDNSIINSLALIEHDAKVENHCHISTGSIINGEVSVGSGSFIGSGSLIKQGVSIGKGCVVGMGLTVRSSLADNTHFTGLR